eukprot:2707308-Amphidinium_carterae.2
MKVSSHFCFRHQDSERATSPWIPKVVDCHHWQLPQSPCVSAAGSQNPQGWTHKSRFSELLGLNLAFLFCMSLASFKSCTLQTAKFHTHQPGTRYRELSPQNDWVGNGPNPLQSRQM